ncbi:MAG: TIGR01459 family HAD-type hydrolase [Hyphomicrobiales bacterium]|nr:MAG: TIGR01459 family HAD-type hydrolase [Hyphomicrobiales bacterium]
MSKNLDGLQSLSGQYRGILCDVWGVLHNGVAAYENAVSALQLFRANGGYVVLLTNSPQRNTKVMLQLDSLGIARNTYDAIVTSGDVTRELISAASSSIYHIGPERDLHLFDGLSFSLTSADEAESVVCTGLFDDENEHPDDYKKQLENFASRGLPFICANPDIVVERGDKLIWCAGALARMYQQIGGEIRLAGKPYDPIYKLAAKTMSEILADDVDKSQLLAIGDGMPTDVAGAIQFGSDLIFVTQGIHSNEYSENGVVNETQLKAFLLRESVDPTYWIPQLIW